MPVVEARRTYTLSDRREVSEALFPQTGSVIVYDRNERAEGERTRDYLLHVRQAPPALVDRMFNQAGEWILTDPENVAIYSLQPGELDTYLDSYTQYIGNLVQVALDGQKSYGFNLHDDSHFDFVTRTGLQLLKSGRPTKKDELRRFVIASRGHDLGNVVSRLMHSTVSPLIFKKMFPSVESRPKEWEVIRCAMEFHDEKVFFNEIQSWGDLSADQIINRLEDMGPELLALVIADKAHIGPDRIPRNIEQSSVDEAVNDAHVEVNANAKTESLGIKDKKTFVWKLLFVPNRQGIFGGRISQHTKDLRNMGEPYMNGWENLFYDIYHTRTNLAMLSTFALYPQMNEFVIEVEDAETGRLVRETFYRVPPQGKPKLDEKIKSMAIQHGYAPSKGKQKGGIRDFL